MNVYGVFRKAPFDCRELTKVSVNRQAADEWIKNSSDPAYYLETISLPFQLHEVQQIYTLSCDVERMDVFVDIGDYFLTYEEAKQKYNRVRKTGRYMILPIAVLI